MIAAGFFETVTQVFEIIAVSAMAVGFVVAADLVRTVTSTPLLTDAAVLAIIVLIRPVLSFSLQIEIEGIAAWRRALLTSPQLIAKAAASAKRDAGE